MKEHARKLLDELLGPLRNLTQDEIENFNVPDNCVFHSIGICPFFSLENTKNDIGKCTYKEHQTVPLKFIKQDVLERNERKLLRVLKRIICELEIRKMIYFSSEETNSDENELIQEIEEMAERGFIEKACQIAENRISKIKNKDLQEKGVICSVCAIKIPNSSDSKEFKSHLNGRLHGTFIKIRQVCEDLLSKYEANSKRFIPKEIIDGIRDKILKNLVEGKK